MRKHRRISTHLLGDMKLMYEQDEQGHVGMLLIPGSKSETVNRKKEYRTEPLIQVKILGDDYPFGFSQGRTMRGGETVERMAFVCQEKRKPDRNTVEILTRFRDPRGFDYEHRVLFDRRYEALETDVLVENHSQGELVLEMLSSFTLGAVTPFEKEAQTGQLVLHRMRSTWSAEAAEAWRRFQNPGGQADSSEGRSQRGGSQTDRVYEKESGAPGVRTWKDAGDFQ